MDKKKVAQVLKFESVEDLLAKSEVVAEEPNGVQWYITPLPDGRTATWTDAELDNHITYHDSRDEAEYDLYCTWLDIGDKKSGVRWLGKDYWKVYEEEDE